MHNILSDFNQILSSQWISVKSSKSNIMENQPVRVPLINVKVKIDRRVDKTMLLDAFWNYANVPKNHFSYKNFKIFLCETNLINFHM